MSYVGRCAKRSGRLLLGALLVGGALRTRESARRPDGSHGPPLPIVGPTTSGWREEAHARCEELEGLANWIAPQLDEQDRGAARLMQAAQVHLRAVRDLVADTGDESRRMRWRRRTAWLGANVERTQANLDVAEAHLIRLAPTSHVREQMPGLEAHVNRFLPKADPRRVAVDAIARRAATGGALSREDAGTVAAAHHAASSQRRRALIRLRSFHRIIWGGAFALVPFAVAAGVLGAFQPTAVPLCFYPEEQQRVVCPFNSVKDTMDRGPSASVDIDPYITAATTRGDILLVEGIGVVAAAVGVALTIRKLRGTSTPFNVPLALAVIKLPLGALTAVMGLLLMAAGFVPGLSALDTSAQILGWAAVFGYAQHLLTRVLDQRANSLLEAVGGRGAAGDREAAPKPVD